DISKEKHITEHDQFLHEHVLDLSFNDVRSLVACYPYVEYLAFVAIYISDKEIH
ncbi:21442_t:CDS:2, partial [Gigaspora margarita]